MLDGLMLMSSLENLPLPERRVKETPERGDSIHGEELKAISLLGGFQTQCWSQGDGRMRTSELTAGLQLSLARWWAGRKRV